MHWSTAGFLTLLFLYRVVRLGAHGSCVEVEAHINTSTFVGCELRDWKGGRFNSFRGIPYAQPPIADLRFKDPVPLNSYPDRVDARNDGSNCPSASSSDYSEDCLFLNVYSKNTNELLPVIVFIHPGGFYAGTGSSTFLGPEYMLEKNIVLVTFNYRLASLGFLNIGTVDVPGNAGLKDHVTALRWTRNNIQHFGGDPSNVTLMGYSAGAMSVSLHLVSPMSRGLFHRAVIMSGSIPPQTKIPLHNQIDVARKQARLLNCTSSGLLIEPAEILDCLNKFNGTTMTEKIRQMFSFGHDNPIYLWLPVIEQQFGQEPFLIEDPYVSLERGQFAKVPILIGFTNGEFCTSANIISSPLLTEFNKNFKRLAPICFMYSGQENNKNITTKLQSHYFQNQTIGESEFQKLCDVFSDSLIRFGAFKLAKLASMYTNVYPYRFSYLGRYSNLVHPTSKRAEHMDDLMYLFRMPPFKFTPADPEAAIVEMMQSFFLNFVINGKLTQNSEFKDNNFINIDSEIKIDSNPWFERFYFWNSLI